jgi:hypothetical protein
MGLLILIAAGIGAFFLYNQFPRESPPPIVSQVVPATPLTPPAEKTDGSVKSDSVPAPPKTKEPLTQGRTDGLPCRSSLAWAAPNGCFRQRPEKS